MKRVRVFVLVWLFGTMACAPSWGITNASFGTHGESGTLNGRPMNIGAGGTVYELDGFLFIPALDLNGSTPGRSARLSTDAMPSGLVYRFSAAMTNGGSRLLLTYSFSNSIPTVIHSLRFFSFLDAEIDQDANTFYNEYGVMGGAPGSGPYDVGADFWRIDEPGYDTGLIVNQLLAGSLVNANAAPQTGPNDVSMALGFDLGDLGTNESMSVRVMIAEDGGTTGTLWLAQHDIASNSTTVITLSGASDFRPWVGPISVYTNVTASLASVFQWQLNRQTGTLLGSLQMSLNDPRARRLGPPFKLAMSNGGSIHFVSPSGTMPDGNPYVDMTGAMLTALRATGNQDDYLDLGETVTVPGIDVFTPSRTVPPSALFQIWAEETFSSAQSPAE